MTTNIGSGLWRQAADGAKQSFHRSSPLIGRRVGGKKACTGSSALPTAKQNRSTGDICRHSFLKNGYSRKMKLSFLLRLKMAALSSLRGLKILMLSVALNSVAWLSMRLLQLGIGIGYGQKFYCPLLPTMAHLHYL